MRNNFTRRIFSIALAVSALLTLCFVRQQVHADDRPKESITFVYGQLGIVRDQTLRYTWANLNESDPSGRDFELLRILVRLRGADGSVLAEQEAMAVGVGHSQSFDFDRNQINARGEPGTERLQLGLEVSLVVVQSRTGSVLQQSILKSFADAIEVFDNSTGRTTVSLGGGVNGIIANDSSGREFINNEAFQIISAGNNYLFGITPDQTLRLTIARVSGEPRNPPPEVNVGAWILDNSGRAVLQSPYVQIPLNQFRIFDFNASSLPMMAEPGTGRKQVRVLLVSDAEFATPTDLFTVSLEGINGDGRTQARHGGTNNLRQMILGLH